MSGGWGATMVVIKVRYELHPHDALALRETRAPRVRRVLERRIRDAAVALSGRAQRKLSEGNHIASGALWQSIHAHPESTVGDPVWAVEATGVDLVRGPMWQYAAPVEFGGRPHMPPFVPLAVWANVKLGLRDRELYRFVNALRAKIRAQGTQPTHFMSDAFEEIAQEWESGQLGRLVLQEIVDELTG